MFLAHFFTVNLAYCEEDFFTRSNYEAAKSQTRASQSGISKGGLSEILNCKKCPTSFTIAKICAVFDITLKEFYNYKDFDEFIENLSIHS